MGNPFLTPGLSDVVPVGIPYTVTWTPTTEGTVTLVLLKGAAENAAPQYAIAEGVPNEGHATWTPSESLAPGEVGYGIQLIDDATGQYQYTTQFGISNPDWTPSESSAAAYSSTASASVSYPAGAAHPTGYPYPGGHNGTYPHPSGYGGPKNHTVPYPTGHHTKPTHKPTHTTQAASSSAPATGTYANPPQASATGGAAQLATSFVGLVVAGGMAVFAL